MTSSRRKPNFAWQAVLILLPVAVMTAIGLVALLRDKAAVQQEAQQRAAELAEQLVPELGGRVGGYLREVDSRANVWLTQQFNKLRPEPAAGASNQPPQLGRIASGTDLRSETLLLPNRLTFAEDGSLVWPPAYPAAPQPPDWYLTLSDAQRKTWDELLPAPSGADSAARTEAVVQRLVSTVESAEARANAEFVALRARLAGRSTTNAVAEIEQFVKAHPGVLAQSGVPLSSLAAAEVLRLIRENRPSSAEENRTNSEPGIPVKSGNFREPAVTWLLDEPSILTSGLLGQFESLGGSQTNNPFLSADASLAATAVWSGEEQLREIAEGLKPDGRVPGQRTTNLWLHSSQQSWFCLATPNPTTNRLADVRIYSKATIEQAFATAVRDAKIPIPEFFGLSAELEGESLILDHNPRPARPLAEASGHLTPSSDPESSLKVSSPLDKEKSQEYGPTNSGRFVLRVYLADPDLLFARQQHRTLVFGGLILLSAFAALAGLAAAYLAFRRQLRLNDLKSNFVSSVSHELRAPIASVRLMAESLERGKIPDPAKQREYFHFISQECRRLSSLIENVLDFSRIDQGRKQYQFEPTDLVALAQQTIKLMDPCAAEKEVRLALSFNDHQLSTHHYQLSVDGKALQQALINLIDNAIKHSPKGATVTVGMNLKSEIQNPKSEGNPNTETRKTVAGDPSSQETLEPNCSQQPATRNLQPPLPLTFVPRPSSLLLWVEDHGPGIPPAEHEKIFERFYRLGSELRRETQGVGIGLSIVKHVVEAHGGRVIVRSQIGQGSRFTIELPVANLKETKEQN